MKPRDLLAKLDSISAHLQSPLLLIVRLWWGWSFAQSGWGKFMNLDGTAEYFGSLSIPLPKLNAIMASSTELLGGALMALGLFTRPASIPLAGTMVVAYLTAHREELMAIFSDTDKFLEAAPFTFLLASLIVLAFGPGKLSLDHLIFGKKPADQV